VDVDPALGHVYTGHAGGTVTAFNADAPYQVLGTMDAGGNVTAGRVNRANHRVYALAASGPGSVFGGRTFAPIASLDLSGPQGSMAIDAATGNVWVTDGIFGGNLFTVTIADGGLTTILGSLMGPKGPTGIAVDPIARRVYYDS